MKSCTGWLFVVPVAAMMDLAIACGARSELATTLVGGDVADASLSDASPPDAASAEMVRHVSVGDAYACAIRSDETLACWGTDAYALAGSPAPGSFVALGAGEQHACGVRIDGTVACWGDDSEGQSSPPPGPFAEVGAGYDYACGRRPDGTVVCWGGLTAFPSPDADFECLVKPLRFEVLVDTLRRAVALR